MKEHHKIEHRNMVGPDSSCTSDTYITYTEGDLLLTNEMHTQCTNLNHALYGRTLDAGKMYRFNLILKPENRSKLSMSINFIGHPTHYTSSKDVLACHSFLLWSHTSFSQWVFAQVDRKEHREKRQNESTWVIYMLLLNFIEFQGAINQSDIFVKKK